MSVLADNRELFADDVPETIMSDAILGTFTQDLLTFCYGIGPQKLTNKDKHNPHGKKIIEIFQENDNLNDFIKLWRQHFLDNNDVKFLPVGWRVDHKIERQFGAHSKFSNL